MQDLRENSRIKQTVGAAEKAALFVNCGTFAKKMRRFKNNGAPKRELAYRAELSVSPSITGEPNGGFTPLASLGRNDNKVLLHSSYGVFFNFLFIFQILWQYSL